VISLTVLFPIKTLSLFCQFSPWFSESPGRPTLTLLTVIVKLTQHDYVLTLYTDTQKLHRQKRKTEDVKFWNRNAI